MSDAEVVCGVSPVTDLGPVCNGKGVCSLDASPGVMRGVCDCEEGWSGNSDFQVTNSLLDCQINVLAIQILWGLFLVVHVVVFLRYLPRVKMLWLKHKAAVQTKKMSNIKYRIWHNKGLFAIIPYVFVGWLCQTIYAIVKIIDQDMKIGQSVLVTVLYIIWRITFYFACDIFQPALLTSLLKSQRNLDHIIHLNNVLSYLHLIVTSLVSITAIIPLVKTVDPLYPIVGMTSVAVFFNVTALAMLFFGIQGAYIEKKVSTILRRTYEMNNDAKTERILKKIVLNQTSIRNTGIAQFIIYGTFGCFPYLWNKHDYMLPFAWCAVAMTINKAIWSLIHEDTTASAGSSTVVVSDGSVEAGKKSNNTPKNPTPAPPPPRNRQVESTIWATSVLGVDEDSPALLAVNDAWEEAKNQQKNEASQ